LLANTQATLFNGYEKENHIEWIWWMLDDLEVPAAI
jgi:hypothetical protein